MKTFIFCLVFGALSVASVMAQEPQVVQEALLSATQHSGFVPPRHRFSIHCEISLEGKLHAEVYTVDANGQWGNHDGFDRDLTADELALVNTHIDGAKAGPFDYGQNPCDIGGLVITARFGVANLTILNSPDCGSRTINTSESAKKLVEWTRKTCKLR